MSQPELRSCPHAPCFFDDCLLCLRGEIERLRAPWSEADVTRSADAILIVAKDKTLSAGLPYTPVIARAFRETLTEYLRLVEPILCGRGEPVQQIKPQITCGTETLDCGCTMTKGYRCPVHDQP